MDAKLKLWEFYGMLFVIVVGTLLHFTYEFSGNNYVVGLFSAVNESTWEHLKLIFWPALAWTIVEYYAVGHEFKGYFFAKAVAIFLSMLTIVMLFYTYTGILGTNYFPIDILTFIIAAVLLAYIGANLILMGGLETKNSLGLIIIFVLAGAFMLFTVEPPTIALFRDPVKGGYGIER